MVLTLVSWNLGKHTPGENIARIAAHRKVDCLLLAGNTALHAPVLDALGRGWECVNDCSGLPDTAILVRQGNLFTEGPVISAMSGRLQIVPLRFRRGETFLLAHAYLREPCSLPTDPVLREARAAERAMTIMNCLRDAEETTGIRRTVLAGDLRVDPYHPSVVGTRGLNATMTRDLALQQETTAEGTLRRRFYNPMWTLFGDQDNEPAGTDFVQCGEDGPNWHIYNQILLRPELAHSLRELRILSNDGRELLVTPRGLPDSDKGICHLPVLCRLQC